jgi:hypothetical protein
MAGATDQIACPTSKPYRKAFAFAAIVCAVAFVPALVVDRPGALIEFASQFAGFALLTAWIIGYWARHSSRQWSRWRFAGIYFVSITIVFVILIGQKMQRARTATLLPVSRQELLDVMRLGAAQAAPGDPNVIDLISERFPNHLLAAIADGRDGGQPDSRRPIMITHSFSSLPRIGA